MKSRVRHIGAGEFKAKCLQLMDEVGKSRKPIVITKRGKPIAKLVPCDDEPETLFGCMKGSVKAYGNIVDPIDVEWEANA
ncbi:MAG TPA: type II toxin-antitoxin system Phd/YefM family antitoxin [Candidatus Obscuribacterales bacterium]